MDRPVPLLLLILDGWGHRAPAADNAISEAYTPNWDRLWADSRHGFLKTSGEEVGLPAGQMGNSEVGHMNIGAGRVVYQELSRINKAIADGEFGDNPAFRQALSAARSSGGTVHLMGLVSPGGVHSHEDHLYALLELCRQAGLPSIAVHAFLDGRDTPPRSAEDSLQRLEQAVSAIDGAKVASVSGRYFAMDRDQRWERTRKAWQVMVEASSDLRAGSALEAVQTGYARGEDDEFVQPTLINNGAPIRDGDVVIFFNFRADRARQLTRAFCAPDFDQFPAARPALAAMVTMTHYQDGLPCQVAFPAETLPDLLGEVVGRAGMKQLRIAETEKYAHVTYFFNGGQERVFANEERVLIPSPKVATYDLQPEMSAPELEEKLVERIAERRHDLIVCNVANPDMVGHTGRMDAAIAAVEAVDQLLGGVRAAIDSAGGEMLVTADHGNVEQMSDPATGQPHTAHTLNPVPLVYHGPRPPERVRDGSLRDLAPTILALLALEKPAAMTGRSLIDVSA
ncbi:MAG: 2,3-bisphosphoglycerate-independent phosphoglycerate mutase [Wenzhouxiangella sp.]|jgi:2,3-bisphosphoglycerate-independent phosphoglycerate mutase|nr:2,3-bisphosphoglycerate-independent phosphoglycerate mutase [Wenzhouxiangella sp.]